MDEHATALVDAVDAVVAGWVVRSVEAVLVAWSGHADAEVVGRATAAGARARAEVVPRVRALLAADIDEQRTTPLAVLRDAVRHPTEVLRAAGVPPVERDEFARRAFPDDDYGLIPASFADVDESLVEPAVVWGAWKAMQHKARRRA